MHDDRPGQHKNGFGNCVCYRLYFQGMLQNMDFFKNGCWKRTYLKDGFGVQQSSNVHIEAILQRLSQRASSVASLVHVLPDLQVHVRVNGDDVLQDLCGRQH